MEDNTDVVVRVAVTGGAEQADVIAARLWAEGAAAVEVIEGVGVTELVAGFPTQEAARVVAARLEPDLAASVEEVSDATWRDAWRQWAEPVPVGRKLLVVPAWRSVPVGSGRLSVEIDPGPCFGSGTHASTRMILAWLDAHPPSGADVLDVGTGSGILAVAAARLGAARVVAVDVDAEAAVTARANAGRNRVEDVVEVSTTAVGDLRPASADVVLVNVTAGIHASIGPACARAARPGGALVLAGLLPGQWQHVAGAYAGTEIAERLEVDGWEGAWLRVRS